MTPRTTLAHLDAPKSRGWDLIGEYSVLGNLKKTYNIHLDNELPAACPTLSRSRSFAKTDCEGLKRSFIKDGIYFKNGYWRPMPGRSVTRKLSGFKSAWIRSIKCNWCTSSKIWKRWYCRTRHKQNVWNTSAVRWRARGSAIVLSLFVTLIRSRRDPNGASLDTRTLPSEKVKHLEHFSQGS